MLLHFGFSEAGLVKKQMSYIGLWSGFCGGQRRLVGVEAVLVYDELYYGVGLCLPLPNMSYHLLSMRMPW